MDICYNYIEISSNSKYFTTKCIAFIAYNYFGMDTGQAGMPMFNTYHAMLV